MKIYEETISALKELKSIASYIISLGKIINKTEDTQLQKLLEEAIIELQLKAMSLISSWSGDK